MFFIVLIHVNMKVKVIKTVMNLWTLIQAFACILKKSQSQGV